MPVPPKTNIGDATEHKSLVGRVKRGLNLADGTVESNKAFRNIRQTAKLIAAEYFDFKKPWKSKDERTISTAVKECVREIPALTPFCFDANCRLLGMHLLARDLLMLCQDETRNISRKPNAAKKERATIRTPPNRVQHRRMDCDTAAGVRDGLGEQRVPR